MDTDYNTFVSSLASFKSKHGVLDEEKYETEQELKKQQAILNQKERELNDLMKDYEYAKDREAVLNGDR